MYSIVFLNNVKDANGMVVSLSFLYVPPYWGKSIDGYLCSILFIYTIEIKQLSYMIPFLHLELSYVYFTQSLQDHWFVQVSYKQNKLKLEIKWKWLFFTSTWRIIFTGSFFQTINNCWWWEHLRFCIVVLS